MDSLPRGLQGQHPDPRGVFDSRTVNGFMPWRVQDAFMLATGFLSRGQP
jgi:hypothetical protein